MLSDSVAVGVRVLEAGDGVSRGLSLSDRVRVGLPVAVGSGVGVSVGVPVAVGERVDGVGVKDGEKDGDGLCDSECVWERGRDTVAVREAVRGGVGVAVRVCVASRDADGGERDHVGLEVRVADTLGLDDDETVQEDRVGVRERVREAPEGEAVAEPESVTVTDPVRLCSTEGDGVAVRVATGDAVVSVGLGVRVRVHERVEVQLGVRDVVRHGDAVSVGVGDRDPLGVVDGVGLGREREEVALKVRVPLLGVVEALRDRLSLAVRVSGPVRVLVVGVPDRVAVGPVAELDRRRVWDSVGVAVGERVSRELAEREDRDAL